MPANTLTTVEALALVASGECHWVRRTTYTNGRVKRAEEFNELREQSLGTTINDGDVWYGHPRFPMMFSQTFKEMLTTQTFRIVVDGNDLLMYQQEELLDGTYTWTLTVRMVGAAVSKSTMFNMQRGQPVDTALVDGDTWEGSPTFPNTGEQSIEQIAAFVMFRVLIDGDDIILYELAESAA